ncbi:MAG: archaeosortase/exosortase family protein, partial [Deltaproteobacteria bacterium]|nr:archaeosortase/exosortase family protein [Deltaproteobacteria bacterium]
MSFILAYFSVWKGLVFAWSESPDYSHGFFIIPICLYILWRKKGTFASLPAKPSRWGLVLVIGSLLVYLFSRFAEIVTLAYLSMVPLFAGVIVYLYGCQFLKETAFPLFLL